MWRRRPFHYNMRMIRGFRLSLAAFLMVALPLQGIAAVTACFCATAGHDGGAVSHGHGHDADPAPADHDAEPGSHGHPQTAAQSHCGPCAACCAVAMVGEVASPALLNPAIAPQVRVFAILTSFRLDPLERPPLAG
jgi:hypothetical protein